MDVNIHVSEAKRALCERELLNKMRENIHKTIVSMDETDRLARRLEFSDTFKPI